MFLNLLLFALGLSIVTFGANWLVDGASSIARRFQVSDIVIGLTIVALGTSAPEMVVSVISAVNGKSDVAIGNVIGSNIVNILLILGVSAIIYPLQIQRNTVWKEIPLSLLAAIIAFVMANDLFFEGSTANVLTRGDGIVLLCFFAIYIYYTFDMAKHNHAPLIEGVPQKTRATWISVLLVLAGIAGLTFGGRITVDNAIAIAQQLGASDSIISLTLVALGTSVPELATSIVAATKRKTDIAIGNIVGSNIFNVFFILGVTSTVAPLYPVGISLADFGMCILASIILFVSCFILRPMTIYRVEGWTMLLMYIGYTAWLIMRI